MERPGYEQPFVYGREGHDAALKQMHKLADELALVAGQVTDRVTLFSLLSEALRFIYSKTCEDILDLSVVDWDPPIKERPPGLEYLMQDVPREGSMDPRDAEFGIGPMLELIRRIEACGVPVPPEFDGHWMVDVVKGRRRL